MFETHRVCDELYLTDNWREILEYSEKGIETKGLAVGGYELSFLADLVASYTFETSTINLRNSH